MTDDVVERHRNVLEELAEQADELHEKYDIQLGLNARALLEKHDG